MSPSWLINHREAAILSLIGGSEMYGREIRDRYSSVTAPFALGSLYTTLSRMEAKGLLESRDGETTHERGGNRRKYFRVSGKGAEALADYRKRLEATNPIPGLVT